ncbi:DUF305 domain-containing protein [Lentzea flava]|uniref:DUF305 domain-containing protein n=1 Tax=Lentzea flava TaxID=103732 RepID=A0ABQ2UEM7_9PSEU|nr:DUF305 domain-containing protein [Lentzea flava]MCP2198592.1 Uncharacterized conserved protein, DUF305 family [Lentzea flava]GGU26926.1 hypothetical protein GCM10010178_19230 [Lentzea flava]
MRKSLIGIAAAGAAVVALVAGCGGNDTAGMDHSSSSTAPAATGSGQAAGHNADDVTFAQGMVPHHQQALDMAKLVPSRSTNAKVLDLAKRIEGAQDPEIQKMNGWLKEWGASTSMPGMDHGSMPGMAGMMSAEDMKMLEQAKGAPFDKMWLEMMIKHHEGAVEMAKTEVQKGGNADAKKLAQDIVDAQQKEITEMRELLKAV